MKSNGIQYLNILLATAVLMGITGCKNDATGPDNGIPDDDAADLIAGMMGGSSSTWGISGQLSDVARVAAGGSMGKMDAGGGFPVVVDTVWFVRDTATVLYTYHYAGLIVFSTNVPGQIQVGFAAAGSFNAPRVQSQDTSGGAWVLSNLLIAYPEYRLDGTYWRNGATASKVREKTSYSSRASMAFSGLLINKSTGTLAGGNCTITLTGKTGDGRSFTKSATVTFFRGELPQLMIAGKRYYLNLALGEAQAG